MPREKYSTVLSVEFQSVRSSIEQRYRTRRRTRNTILPSNEGICDLLTTKEVGVALPNLLNEDYSIWV